MSGTQTGAVRRIAVFDLDGTSIDGQSGALFTYYLLTHGIISHPKALRLLWWGARYFLHLPHRQNEPRELIFSDLGKLDRAEVVGIMRDFHDEVLLPRYRPAALEEVRRRRDEGCATLLVSATFNGIAAVAGEHMGVDGVVSTRMEAGPDGRYTGRVDGLVVEGTEKVRAVARWADDHYGAGGWRIAYAYGDHHSDEELLASADRCFAVCPGKVLRRIARRNGWEVLEWADPGRGMG